MRDPVLIKTSLAHSWLAGFLLFAGIATLPLYLFASGGVQISHVFLICFAMLAFTGSRVHWTMSHKLLAALAFLALVRECIAGIMSGGDIAGLLQAIMLVYNFLILLALYHTAKDGRFDRLIIFAVLVTAIMAVVPILQSGVDIRGEAVQTREIGSFNNPNQLAYFSTCLFSIAGLAYVTNRASAAFSITILAMGLFLTMVSLSKAALLGCGAALILLGFVFFNSTAARLTVTGLVIALALYFISRIDFGTAENYKFVIRLMDVGSDSDDNLHNRGYFVLFEGAGNIFEYLFGLGYKKVQAVLGHEVHSTTASSIMNYGIIGGMIYLAFLGHWIRRLYISFGMSTTAALVLPPMLYGVAHNGTRFTIFYILIGLSYCWTRHHKPQQVQA